MIESINKNDRLVDSFDVSNPRGDITSAFQAIQAAVRLPKRVTLMQVGENVGKSKSTNYLMEMIEGENNNAS